MYMISLVVVSEVVDSSPRENLNLKAKLLTPSMHNLPAGTDP